MRRAAWFGYSTAQDETTFWIKQGGLALLVLVGGGPRARGSVHGVRRARAPRVSASSTALASVVARGGGHARDPWPHRGRIPLRADRACLHRRVLFPDQPLPGLVAAFRTAHQSQHSRVGGAGADADCHLPASRDDGGMRLSRRPAGAGRADRCALRSTPPRDRDCARPAGDRIRRGARELSRPAGVLPHGRAHPAVAGLGGDLPSLWPLCRRFSCTPCSILRSSRFRCSSSTRPGPACSADW